MFDLIPFNLFDTLTFDTFLSPLGRHAVMQTENGYQIEVALPGLSRSDINLKVHRNKLIISTSKESKRKAKKDSYQHREWWSNNFTASYNLPEDVQEDQITARYEAGVLTIDIPTQEKETYRQISVE